MRAPGLLAAPRGFGHHPAQQGQVAARADHGIVERARAGPGAEDGLHALEAWPIAQDPHLVPHHRPYRVAGGQKSARGIIRSQLLDVGQRRIPHGPSGQGTGHAGAEHDALEQGIAGEPVGAVDARARGLAAGEQARDRGPAPDVGPDPAHHVVSGWRHRDGLALRLAAVARAVGVDRREPARELAGREMGGVQPHVTEPVALHLLHDAPGHDVARSQLGAGVVPCHERLAAMIAEQGAVAAQRLGDQEARGAGAGEGGGVKLEELQVGNHRPRAEGQGDPVARRDRGIRGARVELAGASGGQHHRLGLEGVSAGQPDAAARATLDDQLRDEGTIVHVDAALADGASEGELDVPAGGVAARVEHAGHGVGAFARVGESAVLGVEMDAEADQVGHPIGGLAREHAHRLRITQVGARAERVRLVELPGVAGADGGRDTALRIPGGALLEVGLGDDQHVANPRLPSPEGGEQSGDATSDHDQRAHRRLPPRRRGRGRAGLRRE